MRSCKQGDRFRSCISCRRCPLWCRTAWGNRYLYAVRRTVRCSFTLRGIGSPRRGLKRGMCYGSVHAPYFLRALPTLTDCGDTHAKQWCPSACRLANEKAAAGGIARTRHTGGARHRHPQRAHRQRSRGPVRPPAYQVNVAQDRREQSAKHVAIASRQHDGRRGGHRQAGRELRASRELPEGAVRSVVRATRTDAVRMIESTHAGLQALGRARQSISPTIDLRKQLLDLTLHVSI